MGKEPLTSLALLLLRLGVGGLMLALHGLQKLLGFDALVSDFADPIGLGSAASLSLAIFAEVLCSGLIAVGLGTRLAAVPLAVTMVVAAFVVHGEDPMAARERALLYLVPTVVLILTGPGRFSLDALVGNKRKKRAPLL